MVFLLNLRTLEQAWFMRREQKAYKIHLKLILLVVKILILNFKN